MHNKKERSPVVCKQGFAFSVMHDSERRGISDLCAQTTDGRYPIHIRYTSTGSRIQEAWIRSDNIRFHRRFPACAFMLRLRSVPFEPCRVNPASHVQGDICCFARLIND